MHLLEPYLNVIKTMNYLQKKGEDYLFMVDFDKTLGFCIPLSELDPNYIQYSIHEINTTHQEKIPFKFDFTPPSYETYCLAFEAIQKELKAGNTFLTNLTFASQVNCSLGLNDLFQYSDAKYKLWVNNTFVVFSPERFVHIENNVIKTNPMKGTINAEIEHAEEVLLNDLKENAEHHTIVDLLRNDLSIIANQVTVSRFKYLDLIKTNKGAIYQMSSEITGLVRERYRTCYGDLIDALLPAGSICGAPKQSTIDIIHRVENYSRGYYTGIFGTFQHGIFDSAVMIRYIESKNGQLYFKSGGGITALSDPEKEYHELIKKIYVPIF
ncbi:MAG: aminodeoxychorismate synthase component I [Saprospiraceae bacterium]|nr:aminodeoxychorismate synthase component I [Candidatus Defluviibacterium haderslevense]